MLLGFGVGVVFGFWWYHSSGSTKYTIIIVYVCYVLIIIVRRKKKDFVRRGTHPTSRCPRPPAPHTKRRVIGLVLLFRKHTEKRGAEGKKIKIKILSW